MKQRLIGLALAATDWAAQTSNIVTTLAFRMAPPASARR